MNKLTAAGIALEAAEGKRIIIISPRQTERRAAVDAFRALPDYLQVGIKSIRATNGNEQVTFHSGGRVSISSTSTTHLRGHTANIVYVDVDTELDDRLADDLEAITATGGEIIRA